MSNDAEVIIERVVEQTMERALDSIGGVNGRIDSATLDELLVAQLTAEELGQVSTSLSCNIQAQKQQQAMHANFEDVPLHMG